MASYIPITKELLLDVAKIKPRQRAKVMKILGKQEYNRCAEDVFYWFDPAQHYLPYVYTLDPHILYNCILCGDSSTHSKDKLAFHLSIKHGIKSLSNEADVRKRHFTTVDPVRPFVLLDYMPPIVKAWEDETLLMIEKSRDVMATWLIVALYTWDSMFHKGRQNIFQSKTANDTNELVKRSNGIYENHPKFLRDVVKGVYNLGGSKSGELKFESIKSEILGFPQGPDVIRQYHPTGIFQDEAAYQEKAKDAFTAIKPAIQNGGKYTGISSANPGWFQMVCQDRLEEVL